MGIDINSKLLVGRYAEDILEGKDVEDEMEFLEYELELAYASRYYDSDPLENVWGIEIADGSVEETITAIKQAEADFFSLTGLVPRVYQLPDVY